MTDAEPTVPEETTADLADALAAGAYVLDVRRDEEFVEGHVPGAVHIPLDQLGERWGEVPTDRRVHVICAMGGRSLAAAKALAGAGLDVVNVAGGTLGWIEEGRPVDTGPPA